MLFLFLQKFNTNTSISINMVTNKFSIQYSELLEYIYPVTQEYFPDFDYDEETGQTYMLPSQTPDTFKGRYNRGILKGKFSFDPYIKNRELQDLLMALDLDAEKFWYLLLFCYDCSWVSVWKV